jgi:hypothetical protein
MRVVIGVLSAVLAVGGCGKSESKKGPDPSESPPTPSDSAVPDDFKVIHSFGPVQAESAPFTHIEVKRGTDGYTIAERQERQGLDSDRPVDAPRSRALTDEEVQALWRVVEAKFLPLEQDTYDDPTVMDGGTASIEVTAGGKTRNVRVSNADVPGFKAVSGALIGLARTAKPATPPTP